MAWLTKQKRQNKASGRKEMYYAIAWRPDPAGKVVTRGLGFMGSVEANRALKIFEGKQASGLPVEPPDSTPSSAAVIAKSSAPTLATYFDEVYLPVVKRDRAPKTAEGAERAANVMREILGPLPLDEVGFAYVDRYITARKALGRRSRTLILEVRWLKACLTHARDSGLLSEVPRLPVLRDRDRQAHKFLTPEESRRLLEALRPLDVQPHLVTRGAPPISRDYLSYLAILMALNTGMRRNEILSRSWDDVQFERGLHGILLVRAKPEIGFQVKTGRDRAIPLTPDLGNELRAAHALAGKPASGWIFPARKDSSKPRKEFKKALEAACKRADIPKIHPHGLRHTWASRLAMAGVDRVSLIQVGGWTDGRMLDEIYAHATSQHVVETMARHGISAGATV